MHYVFVCFFFFSFFFFFNLKPELLVAAICLPGKCVYQEASILTNGLVFFIIVYKKLYCYHCQIYPLKLLLSLKVTLK